MKRPTTPAELNNENTDKILPKRIPFRNHGLTIEPQSSIPQNLELTS